MIYFFHTVHTEFMYMYMAEVLLFPISVHVYTVKDKIVKFQPWWIPSAVSTYVYTHRKFSMWEVQV